ncbi:MAG: sigma-70 family RNA polymerase sigma factor [Spirochaetes bacterium]|nr:sigma-70 family RNA polymerase sigma factor [Spirochaetota bacterium]
MKNLKETDKTISQGIIDGSRQAYADFSERFSGLIYNECMKYCTESEDTEELLNEVLIHLVIKMGRFNPEKGSLVTWILAVTKNFLRDYYRKKSTEAELVLLEEFYLDFYPAKQEKYNLEQEESGNSTADNRLQDALSVLSERDRNILQYRAEGFSYKTISEFLHIKAKTAKMAYSRAVKKVRVMYYKAESLSADKII